MTEVNLLKRGMLLLNNYMNTNLTLQITIKGGNMNRKRILSAAFIIMFLLVSFWLSAEESKSNPVAVSPGSETEVVSVWHSCPTFSWSAVDQASSYRIAVFEVVDPNVTEYEDMVTMTSPVIIKDIPGPALSWTLSSEESLKTGNMYAWYVQALDDYGNTLGNWSSGKIFKVEQEIHFAGIEEKLAEKMMEYGVNEETIKNILKDIKSEVKEVAIRNSSSKSNIINNQGISGIKGSEGTTNTFYGLTAGASITTGNYNSFFGKAAGVYNSIGSWNTFVGYSAGAYNTSGYENTFLGFNTGYNNSTGYHNTYLGSQAGLSNTTGYENTFLGYVAGYNNTTGDLNTFLGSTAGYFNTTGSWNTFIGAATGTYNTTGYSNTFLGQESGNHNTTGNHNTFFGASSGHTNTTGNYNTFIGHGAGLSNSTGYENTFLGFAAGYYNTTGYYNSFLGLHAGYKNTTGTSNTFLGYAAGYNNTTGYDNTFLGYQAGVSTTIGNYNILLGYRAGYSNTSGSNNTFIGNNAGYSNTTGQGNLFLGYNAGYNETGSNKLYIDNSNTTSPLIYGEFDNNIVTINGKLGIGTKTPAYSVELDTTGENAAIAAKRTDGATNFMSATESYAQFGAVSNHPVRILVNSAWKMILNTDGSLSMANGASCTTGGVWTNASSRELKENIEDLHPVEAVEALNRLNPVKYNYKVDKDDKHVGFIAEDVPELVATADRKGMSPMDVIAVLTRVVQEQQKIIADLQERMAKVEKK
jgi:hypothetical protein